MLASLSEGTTTLASDRDDDPALPDEVRNPFQDLPVAAQITGARHRQVKCRASAGRIADVVDQQAHVMLLPAGR